MVMRRVIAKALEELALATEAPARREPYQSELYNLSDNLTDAQPRPMPPPEVAVAEENRPTRARPTPQITSPRRRTGSRRSDIRRTLSTRGGVRQALIMQEVLGPPKSLRPWDEPQ